MFHKFILISLLLALMVSVHSFVTAPTLTRQPSWGRHLALSAEPADGPDPSEIIARRIIVKGDVNGGYYRSCVMNEAGKFRRLLGNMTPPNDSDTAEIYVEGKRKMVDGFIRWCKRGNVGLNQKSLVDEIKEEEVTGLYDGFYCKTK